MPAADTVAIASLAIAITALLVAGSQLWQAVIGTAEGYRRCAPSVIGPWAKLRRRASNWSEFRFEVEFATPHFAILSVDSAEWHETQRKYGPMNDLAFESYSLSELVRSETDVVYSRGNSELAKDIAAVLHSSWNPSLNNPFHNVRDKDKNVSETVFMKNELAVTWIALIAEVRHAYSALWPEWNMTVSQQSAKKAFEMRKGHTTAMLAIRKWNWDFMPADVLRPHASSALNDIILLALRLNMRWRRLDTDNGIFLATGNGFTLTSTESRGLGIGFTFNIVGVHDIERHCPPSVAMDKMFFGIIPGCPKLVKQDFSLVDMKRELDFQELFRSMGFKDLAWTEVAHGVVDPRTESIVFLSDFLPVIGSPALDKYLPGWSHDNVPSIHRFQCRIGLVEALDQRLLEIEDMKVFAVLKMVRNHFRTLQGYWKSNFGNVWEGSPIGSVSPGARIDLVHGCGEIFDWTTKYFLGQYSPDLPDSLNSSKSFDTSDSLESRDSPDPLDWSPYNEGRTPYVDLVAGHVSMACTIGDHVFNNLKDYYEAYAREKEQCKKHKKLYGPRHIGYSPFYHVGKEYAASLENPNYGIVRQLRERGVEWDVDDIEMAWWVLMLRGIAWDMSTSTNGDVMATQRPQYFWRDHYVPSHLYDDETPVWIS